MEPIRQVVRVPGVHRRDGSEIEGPPGRRQPHPRSLSGVSLVPVSDAKLAPESVHDGGVPMLDPPQATSEFEPVDFEQWYLDNRPTLTRAVTFAIGDADLAREAVDEALTRAYGSWTKVSRLENPFGWTYRVALNWAVSVFRRRNRPPRGVHVMNTEMPTPADPAVGAALDALDIKQRAVVVCRYLLGWSESETAGALNLRPGTVKSRLSRATAILRNQLEHLRIEDSE
jgi:DNA-directed RNA polymerase specialized sigma24 family protein